VEYLMSVTEGGTSSRTRASEALEELERLILARVDQAGGISVRDLTKELEPRLRSDERSLLSFAIHHLLNRKKLILTPSRQLGRPKIERTSA
jgi:hypothetical protein